VFRIAAVLVSAVYVSWTAVHGTAEISRGPMAVHVDTYAIGHVSTCSDTWTRYAATCDYLDGRTRGPGAVTCTRSRPRPRPYVHEISATTLHTTISHYARYRISATRDGRTPARRPARARVSDPNAPRNGGDFRGNNGLIMRGELWGSFMALWSILGHEFHGHQRYRNNVLDTPTMLG